MMTSSDKGPTLQECFPHEVSILPDWTPFCALYFNLVPTLYYTSDCHGLPTLAMSPSTTAASAITTSCLPYPRHKHTSPPLPRPPSCGHLPLSAGGEARVSM
ncbi:hypothetical protein M405DRAFT_828500, partial [Rhizopogon salebrosus TDB-379]